MSGRRVIVALSILLGGLPGLLLPFVGSGKSVAGFPCQYRYGVKVEMVTIYATVRDSKDRLITNLGQDDFTIYENDFAQAIKHFSREYQPLSVVILLDTSFSMSGRTLDYAKRGLTQFLKRLDARDEAMLMTFRIDPVVVQPFTRNLDLIRGSLKELQASNSTALYDAILAALNQTSRAQNRRHALLLISDGINTYGKAELDGTIAELRRRNAELFAIGLESTLPGDQHSGHSTRTILDTLTHSAGGEAFIAENPGRLKGICDLISDRLHNQYTFSYYPAGGYEGEWRRIRIESKTPGHKVVASKLGYYAGEHRP